MPSMDVIGHVTIAGAGPGDPGLLTVAAARILATADVVVYDALANRALLRGARPDAELVDVGKRAGAHTLTQAAIEALLIREARAGKQVLRLKGGDPFVFGRGGEEAQACARACIAFTIIPGVTSAIAGPAYAGIPITHRELSRGFLVITGDDRSGETVDWAAAARADTLVILMGASTLKANMDRLAAAGRDPSTPVACIQWATRSTQRVAIGTVGSISEDAKRAGLSSPMVTVVGDVVHLSREIDWFRTGPLAGRSIVVTRATARSSGLVERLEALGAEVYEAPTIRTVIRDRNPELEAAFAAPVSGESWVVLSSLPGVEALFSALSGAGFDARALAGWRVAAVGLASAEALRGRGITPDFVPSHASGAALATELPLVADANVLLLSSSLSDGELASALRERRCVVAEVAAYDTVQEDLDVSTIDNILAADAITFTSASTVTNLHRALGGRTLFQGTKLVSIGPRTSEALVALFGRVDAEANEPGLDGLVAAIVRALPWG